MGPFLAIARNTFLESVRQPIYGLVLAVMCSLIGFSPALSAQIYTFGVGSGLARGPERMVADLGLATVLLGGLILAVATTASVISREIESHTVLTVLSKKIRRAVFVLGKFTGVALALIMAAGVGVETVMLTVRYRPIVANYERMDLVVIFSMVGASLLALGIATFRNYFRGRAWIGSFTIAFSVCMSLVFVVFLFLDQNYNLVFIAEMPTDLQEVTTRGAYDWDVLRAGLLTISSVVVMASIAVAASTRVSTGGNVIVTALFFLGGLISEYLHGAYSESSLLVKALCAVTPNLQTFWMSEALTREVPIPHGYLAYGMVYAGLYCLAALFMAACLFEKREVA